MKRRHKFGAGQVASEGYDEDPCRDLLCAIVERGVKDLVILRRRSKSHIKSRKGVREIDLYPPDEFFAGEWFEDICGHLDWDPEAVREGLGDLLVVT